MSRRITDGKVVEMTPEDVQREAVRINELLHKVGLSPAKAWNRGEYHEVKRLVELLVSERFAKGLAANPSLQERLAAPSSEPARPHPHPQEELPGGVAVR